MANRTVTVDGLRDLDAALGHLPKATGKAVLRRTLKKAAEPLISDAKAKVPVLTGALQISISTGTKLTKRQARLHRKMFRDDKASVEMFVGAGGLAQATQAEFGNEHQTAEPYMRPAWDANQGQVLDIIKNELGAEIMKAAQRLAKKAAKGK
ncbi:HK97-gp10 family putative phage morphogenesis protein [Mesorhizobium sp. SP-1A]|uniref:HK97-gp10 family putative phage morphogenesis protein n=1 Tax=Mesorhizobium sp. SP-1A TaxID=3077840 RepID=UPI0028F6C715|nr:HK97-gp10 family putative phage morphogenesis protein [Mesorhizobium sp. SP-1A]